MIYQLINLEHEYDALLKNQTWSLVPYLLEMKLIGSKWAYKVKENLDRTIEKLRARLMAKWFLQTPRKDFTETYNPVVKPCTIRVILSLTTIYDWPLRQIDVNSAFFNGELTETVYMT